MDATLVLLAAGRGSRFGGLKQLQRFRPQHATLAEFAIWSALQAGFRRFIAVVSGETQSGLEESFKNFGLQGCAQCVLQTDDGVPSPLRARRVKPWGTGHALYVAREVICTPFVIVNADNVYGRRAYEQAMEFFKHHNGQMGLVGYPLKATLSEHGPVSRSLCTIENGCVTELHECTRIEQKEDRFVSKTSTAMQYLDGDAFVSMNFWLLPPWILTHLESQWNRFLAHVSHPGTEEFYLPNALQAIAQEQHEPIHLLPNDCTEVLDITYQADVETTAARLFAQTQSGIYPEKLF